MKSKLVIVMITLLMMMMMMMMIGCASAEPPKYGDRAALIVYAPGPPTSCDADRDSRESSPPIPRNRQLSYDTACSQLCASVVRPGETIVGCYDARATKSYGCPAGHTECTRELREKEKQEIYCKGTRKEETQRSPLAFGENEDLIVCQMKRSSGSK
jgi:hypothetical protein